MEGKLICYEKQSVEVSLEVADFLEADRKHRRREARSDRRHLVPIWAIEPDAVLETKHHTGHNYLLNRVIRRERQAAMRGAIRGLPPDL